MYRLQPVFDLPPCSPSKVMYQLPNILADKADGGLRTKADSDATMPDDVVTEQKPAPDYSALEARQEKVLDQLAKLKKHVQTLCHFLKQSNRTEATQIYTPLQEPKESKKQLKIDLIVYANPLTPPYSILALQKLWKDTSIKLTSFVHSTIENGPVPVFFPNISEQIITNNVIHLLLIWKKVNQLEFAIDLSLYHIIGEVNLLRYLSRNIDTYNFEKNLGPHDNHILDLCHCLSVGNGKFTASMMSELNKLEEIMNASEILRGGLPRIPDVAVWFTVKQLFLSNSLIKLPKLIGEVYKICEEMFIDHDLMHKG